MAKVTMYDKLAIMPQTDANVIIGLDTFTIPAGTPFTTSLHELEIQNGTVLAVMYNMQGAPGPNRDLQVFSVDAIMTVA